MAVKGGNRFEKAFADLYRKLTNAKSVKVGFLPKSKYGDGGPPVAMVAAIQDYGAPSKGIPPRPFFRNMIAKKKNEWPKALELNLKAQNYDARKALEVVGEGIKDQLQRSIIETNTPPLSPKTIAAKSRGDTSAKKRRRTMLKAKFGVAELGPEKPLIDTAVMYRSVDKEVI